jgi:hypothetical protein
MLNGDEMVDYTKQQDQSPGKQVKSGKSRASLLVDIVTILLLLGLIAYWIEYRIGAAVFEHTNSMPHAKVAVLDYSEIQAEFERQPDTDSVARLVESKAGQIQELVKRGYVVIDGNSVVAAPQAVKYTIKP